MFKSNNDWDNDNKQLNNNAKRMLLAGISIGIGIGIPIGLILA